MDFIGAFFRLTDQYGLTDTVKVIAFLAFIWLVVTVTKRLNKVALSDAERRNRTDKAEAESTINLSKSIHEMADSNNAILKATIEWMKNAESDRGKQFSTLTEMLGQLRGVALAQNDDARARKAMSNAINEVVDRIGPIQTDLHDVSLNTAGIPSAVATLLDGRLTPMITLLTGINSGYNDLIATAKANGQNVDGLVLEVAKLNELFTKLLIELTLFKDLIFDRDDRIANILNSFNTKEKTP